VPPAATYQLFFKPVGTGTSLGVPQAVIMIGLFILVTMGIIAVVQGQRKIPVQYAKRVVGNKVMGGQSSFLPAQGQLLRGHARDLRERDLALPSADFLLGWQRI
jgi:hypothetical protein